MARACKIMKVSASGYYEWLRGRDDPKRLRETILTQHIREIFDKHRGVYGSRRIQRELERRGIRLGLRKISSLMVQGGMITRAHRRRRVTTTDSRHNLLIADNLLDRNFNPKQPNKAWVLDTTYIATKEGWLYLTTVMDLFSRRIVGWAVGDKIDAVLAVRALRCALRSRKPAPGLIVHSARGSQFASHAFREVLAQDKALPSMSRKGDCWDNACAESFFHTIKTERLDSEGIYPSRRAAKIDITTYILYYNRTRLHSSLGYLSPCDFEKQRISSQSYYIAS